MQVGLGNNERKPQFSPQAVDGPGTGPGAVPVCAPRQVANVSPVLKWLRNLGLERYEEAFIREEIDWDTLQWLTEEVRLVPYVHYIEIKVMLMLIISCLLLFIQAVVTL